ncbi:Gx transporter family protein [Haloimpatiens massiliensis]|uniref:Gx transporter family protein n=1 Tax=Haloimpatiens massiliensis TaxID=1658110 RepID=UPI000C863F4F|nr:Gx transporter family protein [Haloimpatiens massiliensis]
MREVNNFKKSLNKRVFLSLMVAVALGIYVIEAQIPVIFPGIKLGLSNVVSLIVLIAFGGKEALLVMFLRTLLGTMFTGTLSSFLFSIIGGLLSNIVSIIMYKKFSKYFSIEIISIVAAVFHNLGQLLVAAFIVQDFRIYVYFPVLMVSALITGYFTGLVAKYFSKHVEKMKLGKR